MTEPKRAVPRNLATLRRQAAERLPAAAAAAQWLERAEQVLGPRAAGDGPTARNSAAALAGYRLLARLCGSHPPNSAATTSPPARQALVRGRP